MGILSLVLHGLLVGALMCAVISIGLFTIKKLKELIRKRLDKKEKQKVLFGKTQKILDEQAKNIMETAPHISMSELEETCAENPYFVVDYDEETNEIADFTFIQPEKVDSRIDEVIKDDGIMLFE